MCSEIAKVGDPTFVRSLTRTFVCCAILVTWFSWTAPADASILLPDAPGFKLESVQPETPPSSGAGSTGSDSTDQPLDKTTDSDRLGSTYEFPTGGAPSSSSSSGGGTGGSSPPACGSCALLMSDPDVAGWVSGQARLALPMPPGNELLRPPQSS